jgi:hypothetical protein
MKEVWSCGGGVQSIGIGLMIVDGLLPIPDFAVISNTGRETESTWHYLKTYLQPELDKVGLTVQIINASDWSYYHKTGNDVFNSQGTLQIPAYTDQSGDIAKLPGYCSSAWKQEPIDRWLRSLGIEKSEARIWLGYSLEEQKRWAKKVVGEDYKRGLVRIPLVEDRPSRRHDCQVLIQKRGWPKGPKSRCWMCPNQNDEEWMELTPEEMAAAVEFDKEMRKRDPNAWLHRSCKPLSEVDFSTKSPDLFSRPCDAGICFL